MGPRSPGTAQIVPRSDDRLVGDQARTIEVEDATRSSELVESGGDPAPAAPPQVEGDPAPVPELGGGGPGFQHLGTRDTPDAVERVLYDPGLGLSLGVVVDVLEGASAALVVVGTGSFTAVGPGFLQPGEETRGPPGLLPLDADADEVARGRPVDEAGPTIRELAYPGSAGREVADPYLGVVQRRRPTTSISCPCRTMRRVRSSSGS